MSSYVLRHPLEQIQQMQQKGNPRPVASGPQATQKDIDKMVELGLDGLELNGLYGVINRLQNSGFIEIKDLK